MVAYSFKRRFVDPIRVGLGIFKSGDPDTALRAAWPAAKRQTIRAIGKRRHARPGETLQLYTAMRTRQCEKIGEARCSSVEEIRVFVQTGQVQVKRSDGRLSAFFGVELDGFARDDGFWDWAEMRAFWLEEHDGKQLGPFRGVLVKWEPLR